MLRLTWRRLCGADPPANYRCCISRKIRNPRQNAGRILDRYEGRWCGRGGDHWNVAKWIVSDDLAERIYG